MNLSLMTHCPACVRAQVAGARRWFAALPSLLPHCTELGEQFMVLLTIQASEQKCAARRNDTIAMSDLPLACGGVA